MSPTSAMAPKQPTRAGWALLLTSVAFRPALLVPAGLSVLGSVSAIMARRPRAKAADRAGAGDQQEKTTVGAAAA